MAALVKYEAACYAIQIAWQIDEVKDWRDKALAMQAYARQAKNTKMIEQATEIRLRAERRCGELLNGSERNKGAATPKTNAVTEGDRVPKTLEEIGLTKRQSSDFQAVAAVPEEVFEQSVATGKASTKSLVAKSPKRKEKAAKKAKPKKEKAAPDDGGDDELAFALLDSEKEVTRLTRIVESLKKGDLTSEIISWQTKYGQLEGLCQLKEKQKIEAEKDARYATGMLAKIRKALGCDKNSEILPAIEKKCRK